VRTSAPPARPQFRPRLPRPTVRLRLTLLYGGLFLASGACLLGFTYLVVTRLIDSYSLSLSVHSHGTSIGVHLLQILQVAEHQQAATEKRQLLIVFAIALAVMAAASAGLGWLMAGRVLRPLRTITTTARHISASNLSQRLALDGPDDELKELGDTFDQLLGRLQASFAAQRQFIANASHELRTPLARQRVLSQVALADPDATIASLRTAHERVLASGAQQERLIEALLTLALSQRGLERQEPFDLAAVTEEVLLARQPQARSLSLIVDARLGPARATGSPGLAERLVANLADNAIRHNLPGGWITVATGSSEDHAILTITSSGPVIPEDHISQLFEPFQQGVPGRARPTADHGLGLGLSIVKAIAATHDARLTARPQPGGGLSIEVRFPAPQPRNRQPPHPGQPGPALRNQTE